MVRFPQPSLITWGLHSHLAWEEPSVEGMVTVGMESSLVLFWGCQSLLYRLPRECLQERQLELGQDVCDSEAS